MLLNKIKKIFIFWLLLFGMVLYTVVVGVVEWCKGKL